MVTDLIRLTVVIISQYSPPSVPTGDWFPDSLQISKSTNVHGPQSVFCIRGSTFADSANLRLCTAVFIEKMLIEGPT